MSLRPRAVILSSLLLSLPAQVAISVPALAQQTNPQQVVITSVRGRNVTLGAGKTDGITRGAVYRVTRGALVLRLQVIDVRDGESTAQLIAADEGLNPTVGDTAQFAAVEEIQQALPAPSGPLGGGTPQVTPSTPAPAAPGPDVPSPRAATLTAITGQRATLGIGLADGARPGAVYTLTAGGAVAARFQITRVRVQDSEAVVLSKAEDAVVTVGDQVQFAGIEPLKVAPPVAAPAVPAAPVPQPAPRLPQVAPAGPAQASGTPRVVPVDNTPLASSKAFISAVNGTTVVVGAGSQQGVTPAANLPILRNGTIIGLLRVHTVSPQSSTGIVLWRDESVQTVSVGDAVGILGANPGVGSQTLAPVEAKIPAVPVQYETGASNEVVPKADKTYELLATLATRGLITSQPPSVFADTDGARRHNTSEDVTFTRAQIAGFVQEAMRSDDGAGKGNAALSQLVGLYTKDLKAIGELESNLETYRVDGFQIGFSGLTTLSGFSGRELPNDGSMAGVAFGDRYGSRRYKTGVDARTNVFGQVNKKLQFFAQIDSGNDLRPNPDSSGYSVRKAYVSYDAGSWLRGLSFDIGRQEFWWGPGHFGTTMLGDAPGGLDAFKSTFRRGSYEIQNFYSPLRTGPAGGSRAIYGQRVKANLGKSTVVGVGNTLLTPHDKFDPKFFAATFTPISLFTISKQSSQETNTVFSGFVESSVAKGAQIYGELVIDDFSFTAKNSIENRDGVLLGAHFFNPKKPGRLGAYLEYARLNSFSYIARRDNGYRDANYDYYHRGAPLGYPIAPVFLGSDSFLGGAESLRLEGYYSPLKRLRLGAGIEFSTLNTEDENAAGEGWTGTGHARQQILRLSAAYDISKSFTLAARAQRVATDQPNFIFREPSTTHNSYTVSLTRHF